MIQHIQYEQPAQQVENIILLDKIGDPGYGDTPDFGPVEEATRKNVNVTYTIDGSEIHTVDTDKNNNLESYSYGIKEIYVPADLLNTYKIESAYLNSDMIQADAMDYDKIELYLNVNNKYEENVDLKINFKSIPYLKDVEKIPHGEQIIDGERVCFINYVLQDTNEAYFLKQKSGSTLSFNGFYLPQELLQNYKIDYLQYGQAKMDASQLQITDKGEEGFYITAREIPYAGYDTGLSRNQIVYLTPIHEEKVTNENEEKQIEEKNKEEQADIKDDKATEDVIKPEVALTKKPSSSNLLYASIGSISAIIATGLAFFFSKRK